MFDITCCLLTRPVKSIISKYDAAEGRGARRPCPNTLGLRMRIALPHARCTHTDFVRV